MSTGIIYCAHCLVNGKKYIGQTKRKLEKRIKEHVRDTKKYSYVKFYRSAIKHGWNNYVWGIVEECEVNLLDEREIYWINYFDSLKNGYNSTIGGEGGINPDTYKSFIIMSPSGEIVSGKNSKEFCIENNLTESSFSQVLTGKLKSHKGWKLPETKVTGKENLCKEFRLMSPDGVLYEGKSIIEFCRKNNLNSSSISAVLLSKRKSHKGWTLPETKVTGTDLYSKEYTIMSPTGDIMKGKNVTKFCMENNLDLSALGRVLSGKQKTHKGWKLP